MQDAEEQCICRTRGYLTADFYMEIGKKNYEVELIVDEDWQCSDCSVYDIEEDKEDVKMKILILNEYSELYATLKREAYEKLDREAKLYEEHEQSLMYDFPYWYKLAAVRVSRVQGVVSLMRVFLLRSERTQVIETGSHVDFMVVMIK